MDVALPHSLRAPNVGLKAASHPLSIQSSLAYKRATAPVCRLRNSGTDRFACHNAIANQSEVGGIVFFYRARLTPCPYYLRSSIRELKPFSSTAKRRGGVRSNYVARGRSWGLVFSKQSSPVSIASSIAGGSGIDCRFRSQLSICLRCASICGGAICSTPKPHRPARRSRRILTFADAGRSTAHSTTYRKTGWAWPIRVLAAMRRWRRRTANSHLGCTNPIRV